VTFLRISGMVVWLTILWILLWDTVSFANIASGLFVALVVLSFARLPRLRGLDPDQRVRINPFAAIWLVVFVLYKLVEANVVLAWEIVTPRDRIRTGVIAVPLRTQSDAAMMVVANVITLTPGTVTIEAIGSPPVLYVHVLHLHEIDEVRSDLLHLESLTVRAFGSPAMRRDLAGGS
jgi:multicomponent Na+:H+ antiporter subunit E